MIAYKYTHTSTLKHKNLYIGIRISNKLKCLYTLNKHTGIYIYIYICILTHYAHKYTHIYTLKRKNLCIGTRISNELKCLYTLNKHKGVISLLDFILYERISIMVLEYVDADREHDYIRNMKLYDVRIYMKGLLMALKAMHVSIYLYASYYAFIRFLVGFLSTFYSIFGSFLFVTPFLTEIYSPFSLVLTHLYINTHMGIYT